MLMLEFSSGSTVAWHRSMAHAPLYPSLYHLRRNWFSENFAAQVDLRWIMQQINETPVLNKGDEVTSREVWERPVLERLAARLAESNSNAGTDFFSPS
ncbi:MAG TPA: hypothetical protein VKQ29_14845 [Aliidongia sp.]|nr:hypothetical protein [Aliidongia sp.]